MKTDLKRTLDGFAARVGAFRELDLPPTRYLMVDGTGDPNTAKEYADALAALYPVAYAMKVASKTDLDRDYVVPPLEALWWAQDMDHFTTARDKSRWSWTVMLMVPAWIAPESVDTARDRALSRRHSPAADLVRCELLDEGRCVQTLHVGPYDDEATTLATMHEEYLPAHGLRLTGRHHEIYLSDPRRTAAARLRTILRQPVADRSPDSP